MYLLINHANGSIEEKGVNKYLLFDSTDQNKELLKKYDVWNGIRGKIKEGSSDECDNEKNYMKIKFNSDDDLTLNKPLKFHNMAIIIRSVFEEDTFVWIKHIKMVEYDRIVISGGIDVNKTSLSKECDICHYWYFENIGFKYEPYLCNGCHDLMQKVWALIMLLLFMLREVLTELIFGI